ncbi:hypothetical protein GIB67_018522 [Kingdonia uniflora]|uniref:Rab-GAP TBC domain-containing protein n=1 Tax=Kingdonia uniflora TaxID=39325 RepID=A0A7J7LWA9_9MAGN|nr:hypothetical protein GIB67_018522 [Kingdonia uniflora]
MDRDAYGFAVRPQHLQRYREYASIYKYYLIFILEIEEDRYGFYLNEMLFCVQEEEEERSDRWKYFLENQDESPKLPINCPPEERDDTVSIADTQEVDTVSKKGVDEGDSTNQKSISNASDDEDVQGTKKAKSDNAQIWAHIRPSLGAIEHMMSFRVKKKKYILKDEQESKNGNHLAPIDEAGASKGTSEEDSDDEFYDMERSDPIQEAGDGVTTEPFFPWKEELECLVRGGVPMALRGELWQTFVGVRARRVERYYQDLLDQEIVSNDNNKCDGISSIKGPSSRSGCAPEKWKAQIEKDLPRTFPGHPALDEDGRNALRRLLTAYARHNPSVGYCQAMNFFAGLLLLLMPEENAFWTLMGIMDDYFDGYYTEEMTESQVDQLAFEDLVRERFPKLGWRASSMGYWTLVPFYFCEYASLGKWSVFRVWDVLLFEGNRVMLFRTTLSLMELYGPALVTTKDAGDAVTLLQTLTGSTFDSSQLVLTASMGYQVVNEARLQDLRDKHRPSVIAVIEERSKGVHVWKDSKGLASKLYSFKHDSGSLITDTKITEGSTDAQTNGGLDSGSNNLEVFLPSLIEEAEVDSLPDLQEQVYLFNFPMN